MLVVVIRDAHTIAHPAVVDGAVTVVVEGVAAHLFVRQGNAGTNGVRLLQGGRASPVVRRRAAARVLAHLGADPASFVEPNAQTGRAVLGLGTSVTEMLADAGHGGGGVRAAANRRQQEQQRANDEGSSSFAERGHRSPRERALMGKP
jgi:hypothetical protein